MRRVTPTSVSDSAFRFPAVHRLGNKMANYLKGKRLTQKTGYKSWNIHSTIQHRSRLDPQHCWLLEARRQDTGNFQEQTLPVISFWKEVSPHLGLAENRMSTDPAIFFSQMLKNHEFFPVLWRLKQSVGFFIQSSVCSYGCKNVKRISPSNYYFYNRTIL